MASGFTLGKSGVDKSYRISDSIRRCEPMHFGIACEPRKLFFCIYARVFSYAGYCCVSVHFSTETGSKLLIAHCIERVEVALGKGGTGLFLQSGGNHCVDAGVYSCEKLLPRPADSCFKNLEGTAAALAREKRRIGLPRLQTYLQCVHHTTGVGLVDSGVECGVEYFELSEHRTEAMRGVHVFYVLAHTVAHGRNIIDALCERVDIHH